MPLIPAKLSEGYERTYSTIYRQGWERRYRQLQKYKALNGDTNVNTKDTQLGDWARNQRVRLSQGKLFEEQHAKLQALGFEFSPTQKKMKRPKEKLPKGANKRNIKLWDK